MGSMSLTANLLRERVPIQGSVLLLPFAAAERLSANESPAFLESSAAIVWKDFNSVRLL